MKNKSIPSKTTAAAGIAANILHLEKKEAQFKLKRNNLLHDIADLKDALTKRVAANSELNDKLAHLESQKFVELEKKFNLLEPLLKCALNPHINKQQAISIKQDLLVQLKEFATELQILKQGD